MFNFVLFYISVDCVFFILFRRMFNVMFEEIQRVVELELEVDFLINVIDLLFFYMYNRLCVFKCLE